MDGGDPNCSHVDIVCIDTSLLSCLSCGAISSIEKAAVSRPGSKSEDATCALEPIRPLIWPASVEYLSGSSDAQVAKALLLRERIKLQVQPRTVLAAQNAPDFQSKMESKPFIYKPLGQHTHIRLLEISPGSRTVSLHGRLRVVNWTEAHTYDALSYTWADANGDATLCRRIFLDDDCSPLPITLSCDRALRSLRKKYGKVTVWVDAICINQWSSSERSHQVSLMHRIYSMADTVHVYVGEVEHGSDKTGDRSIYQLKNFSALEAAGLFSSDNKFATFFSRPYFSRLWVVQEVLLTRSLTMHCGEFSVHLSKDTITKIKQHGVMVPSWISLIGRTEPDSKIPLGEFASLLLATSGCGMSDLRDKIFGPLGLVEGTETELLNADYDLTFREVYIGVAAYLLRNQQCFNILENRSKLRDTYGIPPWVPLWNSETTFYSNEDTSLGFLR